MYSPFVVKVYSPGKTELLSLTDVKNYIQIN